jgi:hypothetical protein
VLTDQDEDDSSAAEPTAYAAAATAKRNAGDQQRNRLAAPSVTAPARNQGVTITITATASDPDAVQPALARLIAGLPAAQGAAGGARPQPAERLRYCWSCGTTRGVNAHSSKYCPNPRKGHQIACTYANHAQFPGFKAPTPRK